MAVRSIGLFGGMMDGKCGLLSSTFVSSWVSELVHSISCQAVLLDIEGTVSPVAFVFDIMFPYIRTNVAEFLQRNWSNEAVQEAVALVGVDVEQTDVSVWLGDGDAMSQQKVVVDAVNGLMDRDAKVTGLKKLQGMIWKDGFESGELVAELFPDVVSKLREWKDAGLDLYIYSSGSIGAQKLFFGYTVAGNLLNLFSGHFDTTSGNKKEKASYETISAAIGLPPESICFISDVLAEVDSAAEANMQTVIRPGDADIGKNIARHLPIDSFEQLEITKS